jgi:molybdenum cofactor cytidylyltransferase
VLTHESPPGSFYLNPETGETGVGSGGVGSDCSFCVLWKTELCAIIAGTMIAAVILAGGYSSRMGRPKALLPAGTPGETFLDRIVTTLSGAGLEMIVAVVGADAERIRASAPQTDPRLTIVENPDPSRGQLSSLIVGLAALGAADVNAALVIPVDQPLVSVDTVRRVMDAYRQTGACIVRPSRGPRHGHPVIFGRSLFDELRSADPALGARAVVVAHRGEAVDVPVEDEGAFLDIDTPEDYERAFGRPPA